MKKLRLHNSNHTSHASTEYLGQMHYQYGGTLDSITVIISYIYRAYRYVIRGMIKILQTVNDIISAMQRLVGDIIDSIQEGSKI